MRSNRPPSATVLVAVLAAGLAASCQRDRAAAPAGVRFVDVLTPGADASSPVVVWIHGRGGKPERFASFWRAFPAPVEVLLPQGFTPAGDGFAWFDWPGGMREDDLARVVAAAEEKLWPAIVERARGRKVIVGGFSQGAVLTFALAARHPDAIAYAFPIAGGAPLPLRPRDHAPTAPVYAMHGADDEVVAVDFARATVAAFKAAGGVAKLRELPGVGHELTSQMRDELTARVRAVLDGAKN